MARKRKGDDKSDSMAFYRFFVGDYLKDASHLSLMEHGCYRRLIDIYMTTGGPLPFDLPRLYRLLHATSKEEQTAVNAVIEEFFKPEGLGGSVLIHKRCERELRYQAAKIEDAKAAVQKRELYRKQRSAIDRSSFDDRPIIERSSTQTQTQTQTQNKEKEKENTLSATPTLEGLTLTGDNTAPSKSKSKTMQLPGFERFWKAYPHYQGRSSKKNSVRIWLNLGLEAIADRVVTTVTNYRKTSDWKRDDGQYVPAAEVWLKRVQWEQEAPAAPEEERKFAAPA
jgi:uncharacterized protein YdaU (DUF1376 family)